MSLVRRIARPLLAAPFIFQGVRTVMRPEREIDTYPQAFEMVDSTLSQSSLPDAVDARRVLQATGAVAAGAGLLYATDHFPRAAAATLLVTSTVGWAGRKKVWELSGEELKDEVQAILTNAGLLGGVMLAVVDTDGKPSTAYRLHAFVERAQKNAEAKQRELEKKAQSAKKTVAKKTGAGRSDLRKKADTARKDLSAKSGSAQKDISKRARDLEKQARKAVDQAQNQLAGARG